MSSRGVNMSYSEDGVAAGFVELPPLVYGDDPQWIPEDAEATERAFHQSSPWFERGEAETFCEPGHCRVATFYVPALRIEDEPAAFFGYFESVGDRDAEKTVMEAAESWVQARGVHTIYGPINFSTYGPYRIRLAAAEEADTFIGEPHNPTYYPPHLEALGFELHQGYCTQFILRGACRVAFAMYSQVLEKARALGFSFGQLTPDLWMSNLEKLHPLVDAMFRQNFAYTPLSYAEFAAACGEPFAKKFCPERSQICYGPEGDIAGFMLQYPHYGPLVTQSAGEARLRPAELSYETHAPLLPDKGFADSVYKTVGVAQKYRRIGLMEAMTGVLLEHNLEKVTRWIGAMMRDDNPSVRVGGRFASAERRYGLYRKGL